MLGFVGIGGYEVLVLLVIAAFFFLLPIMALVDIIRSQFKDSNNKLIWVLVVLFLNVIGAVLYYAIGRSQRAV